MYGRLRIPGRVIAVVAICAVWAVAGTAWAADRDALLDRFDTLKANSMKALEDGNVSTIKAAVKSGGEKLILVGPSQIPPAPPIVPAGPPLALGVKIWGQLMDGQFVNLTKHKFERSQRFYLWLETAVPIQLAFFQNYPEGRPASRQVSPDERFPETFATVMPGVPYRFPVMIQMDDDLRDEQMSIVVVRADAAVLPVNGAPVQQATATAAANAIVQTQGGSVVVDVTAAAQASTTVAPPPPPVVVAPPPPPLPPPVPSTQASASALAGVVNPAGTLKSPVAQQTKDIMAALHSDGRSQAKSKSPQQKLNLVALPPPAAPPVSASFQDVEILVMGPGNVAQIELTLYKD